MNCFLVKLNMQKIYFKYFSFINFDRYLKNISNWPDPGGQMMYMTQNYSLWLHKGNFPGETKKQQKNLNMLKI